MKNDNTIEAFFALIRGGLWEQEVSLSGFGEIDYDRILRLADEQAVVGLVAAGLEHVADAKIPKEVVLQLVGQALQLEQQNKAMNCFISKLVNRMRENGIYALLLKGQGIAQCYERPLWRSCGDVDFFLSDDNYNNSKQLLLPLSSSVETEGKRNKHLGMTIDSWVVELHGSLRCGLSRSIDRELDDIFRNTFYYGAVRSWLNGKTQVFLLDFYNDAIYVFTHFLSHFYKGGVGLRQICDWCRLIWKYKTSLNLELLEKRIRKMKLMSEWKAFGAFLVEYLGMPSDAMPFYDNAPKWKSKALRIQEFLLKSGNFGHNRNMDYYSKYPYIIRKAKSLIRRVVDIVQHASLFPMDSLRFFPNIVFNGIKAAIRGE